ncbi:unnamed protein product [Notodromas monacha]|uniref:Uncharacterized protein n=1 Tax=Notodromas monacha TaxID=399045 RepID=A0A7R9G8Y6_9CRUS|nr:unnamed protein product [Notodromas monacha]CAG0913760.1 unnamed protein product [Notodromas monacha]
MRLVDRWDSSDDSRFTRFKLLDEYFGPSVLESTFYFLGPTETEEMTKTTDDPLIGEVGTVAEQSIRSAQVRDTSSSTSGIVGAHLEDEDRRYQEVRPVTSLRKLPHTFKNPRPIYDLINEESSNSSAVLRWLVPSHPGSPKKLSQYLLQCRTNPSLLPSSWQPCPIDSVRLPSPGEPNTYDRARIRFQPSMTHSVSCRCTLQTIDDTGCVSMRSNEALVRSSGQRTEHAVTTTILLGSVLGLVSLALLFYLLCSRNPSSSSSSAAGHHRRTGGGGAGGGLGRRRLLLGGGGGGGAGGGHQANDHHHLHRFLQDDEEATRAQTRGQLAASPSSYGGLHHHQQQQQQEPNSANNNGLVLSAQRLAAQLTNSSPRITNACSAIFSHPTSSEEEELMGNLHGSNNKSKHQQHHHQKQLSS